MAKGIAFLLLIFLPCRHYHEHGYGSGARVAADARSQPETGGCQGEGTQPSLGIRFLKGNNIMAGGQQMDIHQLKETRPRSLSSNPMEDEKSPRKRGEGVRTSRRQQVELSRQPGRDLLQTDRGTSYETYIMVQNEVDTRLQRGAQRGWPCASSSEIRRSERRSAKYINQGGSAENLGGRTA